MCSCFGGGGSSVVPLVVLETVLGVFVGKKRSFWTLVLWYFGVLGDTEPRGRRCCICRLQTPESRN